MSWAIRRQIIYIAILLAVLLGLGFSISYPYLHKAPTCMDNKQNGAETGVDCGGPCALACIAEQDQISVLWSRAFRVVPGRYNAVAYLENHNTNVAVQKINYRFRFADKDNLYIGKREGSTIVPPSGKFAIFEPAIDFGQSIPIYTTFEFTGVPVWVQVPGDKIDQLKILVSDIDLSNPDSSPTLSATIKNSSLFIIPNVNVVAILYDSLGNAVSASRTYLEVLDREESRQVNFTWPEPLSGEVVAKEIIPMYDIFSVKLK